ncbi:hypothetical protein BDF19DRAFT_424640 [Syncephalis fuscata]|nr:hypothetical protein BDF19DRAFT_424640 [Syncephalis fuscata]
MLAAGHYFVLIVATIYVVTTSVDADDSASTKFVNPNGPSSTITTSEFSSTYLLTATSRASSLHGNGVIEIPALDAAALVNPSLF